MSFGGEVRNSRHAKSHLPWEQIWGLRRFSEHIDGGETVQASARHNSGLRKPTVSVLVPARCLIRAVTEKRVFKKYQKEKITIAQ